MLRPTAIMPREKTMRIKRNFQHLSGFCRYFNLRTFVFVRRQGQDVRHVSFFSEQKNGKRIQKIFLECHITNKSRDDREFVQLVAIY